MWESYIPDNYDAYKRHEAEQEAARELLPECSYCGDKIEDEFLTDFDGTLLCDDCLSKHYRKRTANYIE